MILSIALKKKKKKKKGTTLPRPLYIQPSQPSRVLMMLPVLPDWPGHQARQRSADHAQPKAPSLDLEQRHVAPIH